MNEDVDVYFASVAIKRLEPRFTLPAKFQRMLSRLNLAERVAGKSVAVKMHLGGNIGYSTIHPLFVRMLVEEIKKGKAASVKIVEMNPENGIPRGYTPEVLGCPVVASFGHSGRYGYEEEIGFGSLDTVFLAGEAVDCDFFVDLSHVKGHGDCGFGGAIKNIAMGLVDRNSRYKLHALEGGLLYDADKCTFCLKCKDACPNDAVKPKEEERRITFFFHNCTYCRHCMLVCPVGAITMGETRYEDFSEGMALVAARFLSKFPPENLLFINFLTHITAYCDCWGMTTPPVVPDIGILTSTDIAAVEEASLDLIKEEDFLPSGLPPDRRLLDEGRHLFERIHAKDPYCVIEKLRMHYPHVAAGYRIVEVE